MRKLTFGKWLPAIAIVALCSTSFNSCSSDDNNDEVDNKDNNTYKVTVTINNVETRDYISVTTVGGTSNAKMDVWKVNGVARTGESAIGLGKQEFMGATKTYVVETTEPIRLLTAGVEIINYGADLPFSYKIEKNNKVVIDENVTLKGDNSSFSKNYSF